MCRRALPLLYLNLGGEMMYVLDQRLTAQKIVGSKSEKVLDDISSTMFNRRFLEEIFTKHQVLQNPRVLRAMFDKLAHASIMRLNATSMDKLYDLMVMSVKYQVLMCKNPHDLILVTFNHLDSLMSYAKSPSVKSNIELAYDLIVQNYSNLSTCEMQSIRHGILNFLQDFRVRVSIFLQEGKQNMDGSFKLGMDPQLPRGVDAPGRIRLFDSAGEVDSESEFFPELDYSAHSTSSAGRAVSMVVQRGVGNRGITLGLNMYANSGGGGGADAVDSGRTALAAALCEGPHGDSSRYLAGGASSSSAQSEQLAKEELNLLAKLIGGQGASTASYDTFKINLFDRGDSKDVKSPTDLDEPSGPAGIETLQFDLKSQFRDKGKELSDIIGEMSDLTVASDQQDEDDLLELMDQAK